MSAKIHIPSAALALSLSIIACTGCSTIDNRPERSYQTSLWNVNGEVQATQQNLPEKTSQEQAKQLQAATVQKIANSSPPIKILPLGDSITQGGGGYPSYRRSLWFMLKDAGYNVDFIGSQRDFVGYVPKHYIDFDLDHEGHWGWEAGEIDGKLGDWLKDYTPDIVLLHAGTNDFFINQDNESTLQEIASMINKLRAKNPKVVVLLSKIIPMRNKDTQSINVAIHRLGRQMHSKQSPIVIVDQYTGYSADINNHDNYHPNIEGEKKMAHRWLYALTPYL